MIDRRQLTLDEYRSATKRGYFTPGGSVTHLTGAVTVTHATGRKEELTVTPFATGTPYLATNRSRNIVLVFNVGHSLTHYIGLEGGCTMLMHKMPTAQFEKEYDVWVNNTVAQFAQRYLFPDARMKMIQLGGSSARILRSILAGQSGDDLADHNQPTTTRKDSIMATQAATETSAFRKPEGAVAQIHAFLDKNLEAIKASTVSRKELIEKLEAKEFNKSTIVTQCGVWARTNGVNFPRPSQAEAAKAAAAEEKKAAKKAAKKTAAS